MKQLLIIPVLCLALVFQLKGQAEIFEGLFGKEEPVFHSSLTPDAEEGTVKMAFYFTHPSLDQLEVSFWIKDLGTNLLGGGEKRMVQGLQEYGNRQQADIFIDGLKNRHFYAIGIDYRGTGGISRKFTSKLLEKSYHFQYEEAPAGAQAAQPPVPEPEAPVFTPKPCESPDLFVKMESTGHCGDASRPAIRIQCDNCQSRPWQFSVEARTEFGQWQPLRVDGKRQQARGIAPRTEPLCTLAPNTYYIRVLAWGDNCSSPVIQAIGTPIRILGDEPAFSSYPVPQEPVVTVIPHLPDTCAIESEAVLEGNLISGFINLEPDSPCSDYNPFAKIRYVHPGYRDITIRETALAPGEDTRFEARLDSRDLNRGIHPLQIIVCIRPEGSGEEVPISSFWIRAESVADSRTPGLAIEETADGEDGLLAKWQEEQAAPRETESRGGSSGQTARGHDFSPADITSGNSRCGGLQALQLIYSPERPDQARYISWQNPDCCQEEACEFSVWAGPNPTQLKLLVKGRTTGATARELVQGAERGTAYYEVAVRTPFGLRKAAYVPGEGPKYGAEAVQVYYEWYESQSSEPLTADAAGVSPAGIQLSGDLAARSGGTAIAASSPYRQPTKPLTDFAPCRIFRETHIIANNPVRNGDRVTIKYDYNDKNYLYSLYHLPPGATDWVIAPGTQEYKKSPSFDIQAQIQHSGKYLVLALKKDKSWGCLSAPVNEPIEIQVLK